jgi:pimeloyl-ACP methyl ester carboxylesterase
LHINPYLQISSYEPLIPKQIIGDVYVIGYDPKLTTETFLADMAEEFGSFIKDKIGPCYIAGISYGGGVAIPFAAKFPNLTQKLLLIVSSYALSENGVELCKEIVELTKKNKRLEAQFLLSSLTRNPLIRWYFKFSTKLTWEKKKHYLNPPETLINAYTHMVKYNYGLKRFINNIESPTLMIGGTKDQFFSVELFHELADAIKECEIVLFKNGTHTVPVEKLRKVKKLVYKFLKN